MEGGAIFIGKTRSDKTWQVDNAMERHSPISRLTSAISSMKEPMSGFAVNVEPSGCTAVTATLRGVRGLTCSLESM